MPLNDPIPAVPEGGHDAERARDLHQGFGDLVGAHVLERQGEKPIVEGVEALLLVALAPERLDDLGPAERLVQQHGELAHALLGALVDLVEPPPDRPHDERDEGERDERGQGERPLTRDHDDEEGHDRPQLAHGHDEDAGGEPREPGHVGQDPGHEVRRVDVGEERERHGLDVRVELAAQARHDPLAGGGHQVRLEVAREALDDVHREERERDQLQHDRVAPDEDIVHHRLDEPRREALHRRDDERQAAPEEQDRDVRAEVGEEAAVGTERQPHAPARAATSRR